MEVSVSIDWLRRYSLMKLHFAAEVVLELMVLKCDGITKISAHISESKSRIDFEWPENMSSLLPEIESDAQCLVDDGLPIFS